MFLCLYLVSVLWELQHRDPRILGNGKSIRIYCIELFLEGWEKGLCLLRLELHVDRDQIPKVSIQKFQFGSTLCLSKVTARWEVGRRKNLQRKTSCGDLLVNLCLIHE